MHFIKEEEFRCSGSSKAKLFISVFALNWWSHSKVLSFYFKKYATLFKWMLKEKYKTMNKKCTRHDRASNSWLEITATVVTVVDQIYSCLKVLHLE